MGISSKGLKAVQTGLLFNAFLVVIKFLAGLLGNSYALIADAVESCTDVFSSLIVWSGLKITARPADDDYPYGYGKAESLTTAVVGLLLLGAAPGIAIVAIREILTPHLMPEPYTLAVVAGVALTKELLFKRVAEVGRELGSSAVHADAWHHRSDAITSAAAFIGIALALRGGPGWESADDWAALFAAFIVAWNGLTLLKPAVYDLMDRTPPEPVLEQIASAASAVPGVLATEKLKVRKFGTEYFVDLHVQADPGLSLHDAHALSHEVKNAIRQTLPAVSDASIHMEPFEPGKSSQ